MSEALIELIRRIERLEKELNRTAVIEPAAGAGGGAPADATYVTLTTNATLSGERVATAGANIALSDGGAGGALGIAVSPQGAGSGLDADTVDGTHLASLVQTSRTISAGVALSGGGDLSANRTLAVNIPGLTEELTPDTADSIIVYDASAGEHRRQTRNNFLAGTTAFTSNKFLAWVVSDQNNVVGGSAYWALQNLTEVYDTGGDFNPTSGVFTASVAGYYTFMWQFLLKGWNSTNTVLQERLRTTPIHLTTGYINPNVVNPGSLYGRIRIMTGVPLAVNDTAFVEVFANGDQVIDVPGLALTLFAGHLEV